MIKPKPQYPINLDATVTLRGNRLTVMAHAAVFSITLAAEAVEWIWEVVFEGRGNRQQDQLIQAAAVELNEKGVFIHIGAGEEPNYPLFKTLQPHSRGILYDRQTAVNGGDKGLWQPVGLV